MKTQTTLSALFLSLGVLSTQAYDGAVTVVSRAGIGNGGAAYSGGPSGGGAFRVTADAALDPMVLTGGPNVTALNANQFLTFCIERNEFINYGGVYKVNIAEAADKGGIGDSDGNSLTPDPISLSTAWLFRKFTDGTLNSDVSGFSYNDQGGNRLQAAIWFLENEIADAVPNSSFRFLVDAAMVGTGFVRPVTGFDPSDYAAARVLNNDATYGVKVLNMYTTPTSGLKYHQDVLVVVVPEASTYLAGGLALLPLLVGLRARLRNR